MADYRLDMIMNVGRTKRQAKPDQQVITNRLHKSLQILSQQVCQKHEVTTNIDAFALYLEGRFEEIMNDFVSQQENISEYK